MSPPIAPKIAFGGDYHPVFRRLSAESARRIARRYAGNPAITGGADLLTGRVVGAGEPVKIEARGVLVLAEAKAI